jgi:hypothetical protein
MGKYKPVNSYKFYGTTAIYRSLWERKFMLYCDRSDAVINWSSESIEIPYYDPTTHKWRTYYPDFAVTYVDTHSNVKKKVVEIKPHSQTAWKINRAKWEAARDWCKTNGYEFQVLTEKEIKP